MERYLQQQNVRNQKPLVGPTLWRDERLVGASSEPSAARKGGGHDQVDDKFACRLEGLLVIPSSQERDAGDTDRGWPSGGANI